jgi:uncharacterized protein HemX
LALTEDPLRKSYTNNQEERVKHGGIELLLALLAVGVVIGALKLIFLAWPLFLPIIIGAALWKAIAVQKRNRRNKERAMNEAAALLKKQEEEKLAKDERDAQAAEYEARRPICTHCGKKTEPILKHRRIDGSQDRRYHNNPLLCNRCYRPYAPETPKSFRTYAKE